MFTSEPGARELRKTRRVTFTLGCVRAPWFRTVTNTFTALFSATAVGCVTFRIARSSSTSLERSATMIVPAAPMFRTFQPVRMFPYQFEIGFVSGPRPPELGATGTTESFGVVHEQAS